MLMNERWSPASLSGMPKANASNCVKIEDGNMELVRVGSLVFEGFQIELTERADSRDHLSLQAHRPGQKTPDAQAGEWRTAWGRNAPG